MRDNDRVTNPEITFLAHGQTVMAKYRKSTGRIGSGTYLGRGSVLSSVLQHDRAGAQVERIYHCKSLCDLSVRTVAVIV